MKKSKSDKKSNDDNKTKHDVKNNDNDDAEKKPKSTSKIQKPRSKKSESKRRWSERNVIAPVSEGHVALHVQVPHKSATKVLKFQVTATAAFVRKRACTVLYKTTVLDKKQDKSE